LAALRLGGAKFGAAGIGAILSWQFCPGNFVLDGGVGLSAPRID
jgi:hypothetical protein